MNNYPPGTWEGDPAAPWNAPDAMFCIHCECEIAEDNQPCPESSECCEDENGNSTYGPDEPDWDSMPGGADWDD